MNFGIGQSSRSQFGRCPTTGHSPVIRDKSPNLTTLSALSGKRVGRSDGPGTEGNFSPKNTPREPYLASASEPRPRGRILHSEEEQQKHLLLYMAILSSFAHPVGNTLTIITCVTGRVPKGPYLTAPIQGRRATVRCGGRGQRLCCFRPVGGPAQPVDRTP